MSLFLGKANGNAKLHITSDSKDVDYMINSTGDTSLFDSSKTYMTVELVETVTPTQIARTLCDDPNFTPVTYTHYLEYVANTDVINVYSNDAYIILGKDAYTNAPIVYNTMFHTWESFWVDGVKINGNTPLRKGRYGVAPCGKIAYYLGNSSQLSPDYQAPNYTPSIYIYKVSPIDMSTYNEIIAGNNDIQFINGTTILSLLGTPLLGYGELSNTTDQFGELDAGLNNFQVLLSEADELHLNSDKVQATKGTITYDVFNNQSTTLLNTKTTTNLSGDSHSISATIPSNGNGFLIFRAKWWVANYFGDIDNGANVFPIMFFITTETPQEVMFRTTVMLNIFDAIQYDVQLSLTIVNNVATLSIVKVFNDGFTMSLSHTAFRDRKVIAVGQG